MIKCVSVYLRTTLANKGYFLKKNVLLLLYPGRLKLSIGVEFVTLRYNSHFQTMAMTWYPLQSSWEVPATIPAREI